ncbi:MAG TPA: phosphoribosylformylglycinamidine synthase subunit PurS [Thermoplasmata archaeon]|nr:phosphoribosylformylglycinamidine synthase subunit PurS [Thermoplasmata archaeon]
MATPGSAMVEVRVELKAGVEDPEGESVAKSLGLLGIDAISSVRTAKVYRIAFTGVSEAEAAERAQRAVDRLLANPVVHRVSVTSVPG